MKFKKAEVLRLKGRKNSQKNDIFWDVILVIKANIVRRHRPVQDIIHKGVSL